MHPLYSPIKRRIPSLTNAPTSLYRLICLTLFLCLWSSWALAGPKFSLSTDEGRLQFLKDLDESFGATLLAGNNQFRRNMISAVIDLEKAHQRLGSEAVSLDIPDHMDQDFIEYFIKPDPTSLSALAQLKKQLTEDSTRLKDLTAHRPPVNMRDPAQVLGFLKVHAKSDKDFSQDTSSYFRLYPLLTSGQSESIAQQISAINSQTTKELYAEKNFAEFQKHLLHTAQQQGFEKVPDLYSQFFKESVSEEVGVDPGKFRTLQEQLHSDLKLLKQVHFFQNTGLSKQNDPKEALAFLKAQAKTLNPPIAFAKCIAAFLRLSPLLASDRSDERISDAVEHLTPEKVRQFYTKEHLEKLQSDAQAQSNEPGFGEINRGLRLFQADFLNKTVANALALQYRGKPLELKKITLEQVPGIITPFRGCFGGDCAIASVPYYALARGVSTYWIKENNTIKGYVLISQATLPDKRTIPYVITINGPHISPIKAQKIIELVCKMNDVSEILLPDFSKNHAVVNDAQIQAVMQPHHSIAQEVTLPQGMEIISQLQNDKNTELKEKKLVPYSNYYDPAKLKHAQLASTSDLQISPETTYATGLHTTQNTSFKHDDNKTYKTLSLVDKAIFAAHILNASDDEINTEDFEGLKKHTLAALSLTEDQFKAARMYLLLDGSYIKTFNYYYPWVDLTYERYKFIQKQLGLDLNSIIKKYYTTIPGGSSVVFKGLIDLHKDHKISDEEFKQLSQLAHTEEFRLLQIKDGEEKTSHSISSTLSFMNRPHSERWWNDLMTSLLDDKEEFHNFSHVDFFKEFNDIYQKKRSEAAPLEGILEAGQKVFAHWPQVAFASGLTAQPLTTESEKKSFLAQVSILSLATGNQSGDWDKLQKLVSMLEWIEHTGPDDLKKLAHQAFFKAYCSISDWNSLRHAGNWNNAYSRWINDHKPIALRDRADFDVAQFSAKKCYQDFPEEIKKPVSPNPTEARLKCHFQTPDAQKSPFSILKSKLLDL